MKLQPVKGVERIRVYRCEACHSEFRHQLVIPPEPTTSQKEPEHVCNQCFESDVLCANCGDGICEEHQKSLADLKDYLPREMMLDLDRKDLDQIYCPLCFPLVIERKTMKVRQRKKPDSPLKNPMSWLLMAAIVFLSFAAKNC